MVSSACRSRLRPGSASGAAPALCGGGALVGTVVGAATGGVLVAVGSGSSATAVGVAVDGVLAANVLLAARDSALPSASAARLKSAGAGTPANLNAATRNKSPAAAPSQRR